MFPKLSLARVLVRVTAICAVVLSAGATQTANAALVTYRIDFTASNFYPIANTQFPAPVDPVKGTLLITFDPMVGYSFPFGLPPSPGTSVTGKLNIKTAYPYDFSYDPNMSGGSLQVCTPYPLDSGCGIGAWGVFGIYIANFLSGTPSVTGFFYNAFPPGGLWQTATGSAVCLKPSLICQHVPLYRCRRVFRRCP